MSTYNITNFCYCVTALCVLHLIKVFELALPYPVPVHYVLDILIIDVCLNKAVRSTQA